MAAADDALKALFGAVKKTVDVGDVTRAFNPARIDAVGRMLKGAEDVVAPRLTLGEGLTSGWGFKPKPGDWDVEAANNAFANWTEDSRDEIVSSMLQDAIEQDREDFTLQATRELLDNYFPDYERYPRTSFEALDDVEQAFKQFGGEDVPYADAKDFTDWLDIELDNRRTRFLDNVDYGDYHNAADQYYEAENAYATFDDLTKRIAELPDNHPFKKSVGNIMGSYPDYWNDSEDIWGLTSDLKELQDLGVNRDIIAEVWGSRLRPMLQTQYGRSYNNTIQDYLTPVQVRDTLASLDAPTAASFVRAIESNNTNPYTILKTAAGLEDPAVRDVFLGLLPGWEDSIDEAVNTARLLAE